MKKKILITGGAGYIGAHVYSSLKNEYEIFILDNLSNGSKENIKTKNFFNIDITKKKNLNEFLSRNKFHIIIHLAALVKVDESVKKPKKYFNNNLIGTLNLLECMRKHNIKNIIFSSTAAVYKSNNKSLKENDFIKPENPYGESKFLAEQLIRFYSKLFDINVIIFRFFNVSGSDYKKKIGERVSPPTHFITILIHNVLRNKLTKIFGGQKTKDGSGIRDYIHINDISIAFKKSVKKLISKSKYTIFKIYNLGTGKGYSTYEVVNEAKKIVKKKFKLKSAPKRLGDADIVVCDYNKIKKDLKWSPKNSSLKKIIKSTYEWEKIIYREK